jgi:hypothetical protein
MNHIHTVILLSACLAGGVLLDIKPAAATVFCDVKKTRDGFVALRSEPDSKAKLVARMRFGDEVQAITTAGNVNGWMQVIWWKGGRFKSGGPHYDASSGKGWAYRKFIDECG